jgi:hypothetical protein
MSDPKGNPRWMSIPVFWIGFPVAMVGGSGLIRSPLGFAILFAVTFGILFGLRALVRAKTKSMEAGQR